jgi:Spy/CpxP family protein refolding chaperone
MNRFRLLTIAATLMAAMTVSAQTVTAATSANKQDARPAAQTTTRGAEQHLKLLSEKLDLTVDQQAKIRPILQHMMNERQKLMQDSSLSEEAREQKMRAVHDKADKQARKFLTDDQKTKLDDLEQQPHP